jgi:UDP-3-O-[3-hydroxymyristoyl] glucosamine N-acyltransferase
LSPEPIEGFEGVQIVVPNPQLALASILEQEEADRYARKAGIHAGASVHGSAWIGEDAFIGSGAVVEENAEIGPGARVHANATVARSAVLGERTVVHAGAVVGEGVRVGKRCVIGPNTCLGASGFGVVRGPGGALHALPQIGGVEVGDDVEIGALCTVDRGTLEATTIGSGTKMDNHCHIAHNVRIGRDCLLVAYARIAGSTVLEDGVTVAEDVGITDNVVIGAGARIGGGARVYKNVSPGAEVWGAPAKPLAEERRLQALLRRLPALREKVRALWRGDR